MPPYPATGMGASLHLSPTVMADSYTTFRNSPREYAFKDTTRLMPSADNPKEYTFRDDSRFMPNATGYFKDTTRIIPPAAEEEDDVDPFSDEAYAAADAAEAEIVARRNLRRDDSGKLRSLVIKKAAPEMGYESLTIDDEYSEPVVERQRNREPISFENAVNQRYGELRLDDSTNMDGYTRQKLVDGLNRTRDLVRKAGEMSDVPRDQMVDAKDLLFGSAAASDARRQRMAEEMSDVPSGQMANAEDILRGSADTAEARNQRLNDFKKIMGSSFNPKSSADAQKMDVLLQFKQQYPDLSTNALALKIYRSGAL